MDLIQFYALGNKTIAAFDDSLQKFGLADKVRTDHICYKCSSAQEFEGIRTMFEQHSNWIYQSIISQRRIAYIHLSKPFESVVGSISYLELSDQKPDNSQTSGFEHIEIMPVKIAYEDLISLISAKTAVKRIVRPHYTTDDVHLADGFIARFCKEPLVEKIKREEMR